MTLSATSIAYQVVRADIERDRTTILEIWRRNLPDPSSHAAKYDWHYLHNPAGRGLCWLLQTSDGQFVGTAGLGRRRLAYRNSTIEAGIASDLAVDESHRTFAPALMLQKAVLSILCDELSLIYGLPNAKALAVFRRLGYQAVGTFHRYVKILHARRYLRSLPGLLRFAHLSSPAVNLALRAVSPETWRFGGPWTKCEMPDFDERFDDLWQRTRNGLGLIAQRDARYLQWRFKGCPVQRYITIGLLSSDRRFLVGYGVFYIDEDQQAKIVDIQHDCTPGALEEVFCGVICAARGRGAASICCEFLGAQPRMLPILKKLNFRARPSQATITAMPKPQSLLAQQQELVANWYFLRNDEDYN